MAAPTTNIVLLTANIEVIDEIKYEIYVNAIDKDAQNATPITTLQNITESIFLSLGTENPLIAAAKITIPENHNTTIDDMAINT